MGAGSSSGSRGLSSVSSPAGLAAFEQFTQSAPRAAKGWTVVHVDLANFAMINRVLGRRGGDKILLQVGRALQREASFNWFHLGGDSWVGISERRPQQIVLHQLAQLRSTVRGEVAKSVGRAIRLDAYFGLAGGRNMLLVAQQAEIACREARRTTQRFLCFDDLPAFDADQGFVSRYMMGEPVSGLVQLYRQAIEYPGDGVAYEVLSRHRGQSMACELMTVERLGLAAEFDLALVREALSVIPGDGPRHTLNLSNLTVRDSSALVALISMLHGRKNIAVEVTETAAIEDIRPVSRAVEMFRAAGVDVYLDDFGEGAASLSMLALPWSAVKLSRTICGEGAPLDVLQSVVGLAQARKMQVIAECVETQHHKEQLMSLGINGFQGFYIHRPEPIPLVRDQASAAKRCHNE